MGLKNSQYHAIMRKYEQKQLHSHDIQVARYEEVYKKLPEFKALDDSIASLSIQYGKKLLDGDTSAVDALKKDLAELRNRKIHLLKSAGFPEDYLEPVYDCPDCKDTTLRICHHFIDSFGTEFNNLFFYGDVGVGKTFLSTCIAKEIMNREYSVLYFSAPQLFNTLAKNAFDKNDIDAHNMCEYIFDCDLLIIDDLGTEYTNAFIASQFFTCINERLLHRKSTIISTNLSLESLADLYTERSFSRITSRYSLLKIVGDDIRIKKKLEH